MSIRTLVALLAITVVSCGIASGQAVVKTGEGSITISVSASARPDNDSSERGWLGVRISPVPAPLAAHLKSKNIGAMVTNLIKGSPAHKAGVKQYDVIVGLDKGAVKNGQGLIKTISNRKAGEKITLWVMRMGKKIQIPIVLGKPVPANKVQLLHKGHPLGPWNVQRDITRVHPHVMLRKGQAGDWEKMEGKDLPEEIRKMLKAIPKNVAPGNNVNASVNTKTVIHTKDSEGSDVRIETDETGKITVRRKQRADDGSESDETKTYKDREHLRLSDPDAFDLLKKCNIKIFTPAKPGQMKKLKIGQMPEIRLFAGGDHAGLTKEIHEQILKSIEKMDLSDDMKKQIIKQLQDKMDKKPAKKQKANTPKKAGTS